MKCLLIVVELKDTTWSCFVDVKFCYWPMECNYIDNIFSLFVTEMIKEPIERFKKLELILQASAFFNLQVYLSIIVVHFSIFGRVRWPLPQLSQWDIWEFSAKFYDWMHFLTSATQFNWVITKNLMVHRAFCSSAKLHGMLNCHACTCLMIRNKVLRSVCNSLTYIVNFYVLNFMLFDSECLVIGLVAWVKSILWLLDVEIYTEIGYIIVKYCIIETFALIGCYWNLVWANQMNSVMRLVVLGSH